jgi:hypothetical protein
VLLANAQAPMMQSVKRPAVSARKLWWPREDCSSDRRYFRGVTQASFFTVFRHALSGYIITVFSRFGLYYALAFRQQFYYHINSEKKNPLRRLL